MYDTNQSAITEALQDVSAEVFSASTIDSILSLVTTDTNTTIVADQVTVANNGTLTVAEGTEIAFVTVNGTAPTTLTVNADIPVVLFQGNGGVDATFNAPAAAGGKEAGAAVQAAVGDAIERVIVGTAGADKITIVDGKATQVVVGDKDVVTAGSGHTVVVAAQGSSTVVGGGDTIVQAVGEADDFTVTAKDGHALIKNATTGVAVDISNAQFVQLDNNEALIFAANDHQAVVANLYQALFGRTADAAGLHYWYEVTNEATDVGNVAAVFMASTEYTGETQTDAEFVASLYQNVLGRAGDAGGVTYWTEALADGASRANVAAEFVVGATNPAEINVVGSVTVVEGIHTA